MKARFALTALALFMGSAACSASHTHPPDAGVNPARGADVDYQNPIDGVVVKQADLSKDLAFELIIPPTSTFGNPTATLVNMDATDLNARKVAFQYTLPGRGLVDVGESLETQASDWQSHVGYWTSARMSAGSAQTFTLPDGSTALITLATEGSPQATIEWLGPKQVIDFGVEGPDLTASDVQQLATSIVNAYSSTSTASNTANSS
jgi:hypothetical protein